MDAVSSVAGIVTVDFFERGEAQGIRPGGSRSREDDNGRPWVSKRFHNLEDIESNLVPIVGDLKRLGEGFAALQEQRLNVNVPSVHKQKKDLQENP